jgi:hypothetical protein
MKKYILLLTLLMPLLHSCRQPVRNADEGLINSSRNPITVSGKRFIDSYGRQMILNGINKVNKNQKMNYTDNDSLLSYKQLTRFGFNCIRLGIAWDVIGFDIMNEPFNGSQGTSILPRILEGFARLYAEETGKVLSQSEVLEIWADENKRFDALAIMKDSKAGYLIIPVTGKSAERTIEFKLNKNKTSIPIEGNRVK